MKTTERGKPMPYLWKYAVAVQGLDDVGVLFLPHAASDVEARSEAATSDRADPRRVTTTLYRIECIIDELGDKDFEPLTVVRGRHTRGLFIQTGREDTLGRDVVFAAESASAAIAAARKRPWSNIRLYQCEQVPLG